MIQFFLHFLGDFVMQNDYIALNKHNPNRKGYLVCLLHCAMYSLPFILITNWINVILIFIFHFIIDKWDLVKYFILFKNGMFQDRKNPGLSNNFGYTKETPKYLAHWLFIIHDNLTHLLINYLIIKHI